MHPSQQILSSTEYTDKTRYKFPTGNQMHGKKKPNSVTVNEYKEGCDYSIEHRVKSEMSRGEEDEKEGRDYQSGRISAFMRICETNITNLSC